MTILLAPVRPDRFPRDLQPPAEIPGITTDRVIPRHADSPQEPEPERSKSMPYERIVSSDRPAACKWPK
jgi:hypothetical protein